MSTNNKISLAIVIAVLVGMAFAAGIYAPWNWLLFKTFVLNQEPISVETIAPTHTATSVPNATFTTMPSPTRFQSITPTSTRIASPTATATSKVVPTFEPIILKGKIKSDVVVRQKAGENGKRIGVLKAGSEVTIVDGTVLGEGGPLWDEIYYPIGQTKTTGWIPGNASEFIEPTPTPTPDYALMPSELQVILDCKYAAYGHESGQEIQRSFYHEFIVTVPNVQNLGISEDWLITNPGCRIPHEWEMKFYVMSTEGGWILKELVIDGNAIKITRFGYDVPLTGLSAGTHNYVAVLQRYQCDAENCGKPVFFVGDPKVVEGTFVLK